MAKWLIMLAIVCLAGCELHTTTVSSEDVSVVELSEGQRKFLEQLRKDVLEWEP